MNVNRKPQSRSTRVRLGSGGFMILLAMLYVAEGLGQPSGLLAQPARFLLVSFGWTPLEISGYIQAAMLPWVFKPVLGILSDDFPLFGYRRKSYLLISNVMAAVGFFWVGYANSTAQMQAALFLTALGMAMTTAVAGALVVEIGKQNGKSSMFVSQQWLWFSIAAMATAHYGGKLTQRFESQPWSAVHLAAWIVAAAPVLCFAAAALFIDEPKAAPATESAAKRVWETLRTLVESKAIWSVSIFIFLYFYNPGFGQALYNYQTKVLGLDQQFLGDLDMIAALGSIVGTVLYMLGSRFVSMRAIVVGTILVGTVVQAAAIIYTSPALAPWGLLATARYLSFVAGAVGMIGMLTAFTLAVDYCPKGAEGLTYAWLAAVHNLANPASDISGSYLYQTIFAGNLQGLILVSAAVTLLALPVLFWLKIGKQPPDSSA